MHQNYDQIIIAQPSHPFTTPERINRAWDSSMQVVSNKEASASVELLRKLSVLANKSVLILDTTSACRQKDMPENKKALDIPLAQAFIPRLRNYY